MKEFEHEVWDLFNSPILLSVPQYDRSFLSGLGFVGKILILMSVFSGQTVNVFTFNHFEFRTVNVVVGVRGLQF